MSWFSCEISNIFFTRKLEDSYLAALLIANHKYIRSNSKNAIRNIMKNMMVKKFFFLAKIQLKIISRCNTFRHELKLFFSSIWVRSFFNVIEFPRRPIFLNIKNESIFFEQRIVHSKNVSKRRFKKKKKK